MVLGFTGRAFSRVAAGPAATCNQSIAMDTNACIQVHASHSATIACGENQSLLTAPAICGSRYGTCPLVLCQMLSPAATKSVDRLRALVRAGPHLRSIYISCMNWTCREQQQSCVALYTATRQVTLKFAGLQRPRCSHRSALRCSTSGYRIAGQDAIVCRNYQFIRQWTVGRCHQPRNCPSVGRQRCEAGCSAVCPCGNGWSYVCCNLLRGG